MSINDKNKYKGSAGLSGFRKELEEDLKNNLEKFKDPVVLGELMYKLKEERENTNHILKNILQILQELKDLEEEKKGPSQEVPLKKEEREDLLPEIDQRILSFVREKGKATNQDVQRAFGYKGRNGASVHLNKLYALGFLRKKQVGKKVYFLPT